MILFVSLNKRMLIKILCIPPKKYTSVPIYRYYARIDEKEEKAHSVEIWPFIWSTYGLYLGTYIKIQFLKCYLMTAFDIHVKSEWQKNSSIFTLFAAIFSYLWQDTHVGNVIECCPLGLKADSIEVRTRWYQLVKMKLLTTTKTVIRYILARGRNSNIYRREDGRVVLHNAANSIL